MASLDDRIRTASPGDPELYEALMVEYYNFVCRITGALLRDPDEAEDAAQDTFIHAATRLAGYQPGTSLKSWLAKIAINLCRDALRKRKARQRLQDLVNTWRWPAASAPPAPEESAMRSERRRTIQTAIEGLDEKHRLTVLLRYAQGMSIAEIAQALEINEGTVHSRLHYAHRKLRDRLEALGHEIHGAIQEELE